MRVVEVIMALIKLFFVCCLLSTFQLGQGLQRETSGSLNQYEKNEFIFGGVECTQPVPFIASLMFFYRNIGWRHICGAAIITNKHVLTAAHCLNSKLFEEVSVYVGSKNIKSGGSRHQVALWVQHPDYRPNKDSDIAVVKIKGSFTLSQNVRPIEFHSSRTVPENQPCMLYGWGKIDSGVMPDTLHCMNATTLSVKTCTKFFAGTNKKHLCSHRGMHHGICDGDSGGPLTNVNSNLLIGVIAEGPRNCGNGQPDINTRVSYFVKWIDKSVKI